MRELKRITPANDPRSVLRAAIEVFSQHGYDATSMDDVAEVLAISRPALYYHVPSKVELLRRALEPILKALEDITYPTNARTVSAEDRIILVVQQVVTIFTGDLPSASLLLRLRGNTDVERKAIQRRCVWEKELSALMCQVKDEGFIRHGPDPRLVARLLIGMVYSTVEWYDPADGPTPQKLAREIFRLTFSGLRTPREAAALTKPDTP
ncbi:TetR/AcrR family transcriptional regulator [Paenarthrobacter sp. JL.01a]|uniref:TetR/AcrR family transcriptional regulator n=1 Tax=Paenarthrobacter sp. JL.01a TaxID=2979324 RepID=UPI0021CAAF01|nr:TetR/AcrR family transcriptional regulator [Paenarthrobacter sp. JL.01a]UXM93490.1 TetR/AcrR family transcriptional regulator [Paenarthrobacter sp. JL.01a]